MDAQVHNKNRPPHKGFLVSSSGLLDGQHPYVHVIESRELVEALPDSGKVFDALLRRKDVILNSSTLIWLSADARQSDRHPSSKWGFEPDLRPRNHHLRVFVANSP
jgi:hypothetical protein